MKFSVIIPIYNVENYLVECIESVVGQEFDTKRFEVLLIDDGSTDNSGDICDKYSLRFHHTKVIHKENGGLSDARNAGILASKGEYIIFLDGDDTLGVDTLNVCDKLLLNHDIIIGNQSRITKNGIEKKDFPVSVFDNKKGFEKILETFVVEYEIIPWAAYQSVYKAEVLKKNEILFKKGLIGAEDCDFFFRYIKHIESYLITNHSFVNYLMVRPDSIMNKVKLDSVMGRLETFSDLFFQSKSRIIQEFFSFKFCNTILDFPKIPLEDDRLTCINYVKRNQSILDYSKRKSKKYCFANILWSSFGFIKGSNIINNLLKKSGVKV